MVREAIRSLEQEVMGQRFLALLLGAIDDVRTGRDGRGWGWQALLWIPGLWWGFVREAVRFVEKEWVLALLLGPIDEVRRSDLA